MNTNNQILKWVLLNKFCKDTGFSENAVRLKITKGIWRQDKMVKTVCRRIFVNVIEYDNWVENYKEKLVA